MNRRKGENILFFEYGTDESRNVLESQWQALNCLHSHQWVNENGRDERRAVNPRDARRFTSNGSMVGPTSLAIIQPPSAL